MGDASQHGRRHGSSNSVELHCEEVIFFFFWGERKKKKDQGIQEKNKTQAVYQLGSIPNTQGRQEKKKSQVRRNWGGDGFRREQVRGGESLRDSRGHVEALVGVGGERPYFFLPGRAAPSAGWCSCGCGGLGLTGTWQDLARLFFFLAGGRECYRVYLGMDPGEQ